MHRISIGWLLTMLSCGGGTSPYGDLHTSTIELELIDATGTLDASGGAETARVSFAAVLTTPERHTVRFLNAAINDPESSSPFTTVSNLDGASFELDPAAHRFEAEATGTRSAPAITPWTRVCQGSLSIALYARDETNGVIYAEVPLPITVNTEAVPHELNATSATRLGGDSVDNLHSLAGDVTGDAWALGASSGGTDRDGSALPNGIYLARIAPSGERRWLRELPHSGFLASAPQAIYLASEDDAGPFVARLDEAGAPVWLHHDEALLQVVRPVADEDGVVTAVLTPSGPQATKLADDSTVRFITSVNWGARQFLWDSTAIALDEAHNIYLIATEFDGSAGQGGIVHLTKLDPLGAEQWQTALTDDPNRGNTPPSLVADAAGNTFVGLTGLGGYVIAVSPTGEIMAEHSLPANGVNNVESLAIGPGGKLVIARTVDGIRFVTQIDRTTGALLLDNGVGCSGGAAILRWSPEPSPRLLLGASFVGTHVAGNTVLQAVGESDAMIAWLELSAP